MSALSLQQFVDLQDRDGHEREFYVDVHELDGGFEAVLYIRPLHDREGDGWEDYARVLAPSRIDAIQAVAHYMVTA
jgi:hypothetical protein